MEESSEEEESNAKNRFMVVAGPKVEFEEGEIIENDSQSNKTTVATSSSISSQVQPPALVFNDNSQIGRETAVFPNTFHLLQCFTLRSASDAFDLERLDSL